MRADLGQKSAQFKMSFTIRKLMQAGVLAVGLMSLSACSAVSAVGGATYDVAAFAIGDVLVPVTTTVIEAGADVTVATIKGAADIISDNPDTAIKGLRAFGAPIP
ncbi:hypothetical protein [Terasakiella sp. SH-1]|uniref:hypothetical protein n=1 Tax=Terasakiella sp. SH-1 TaxID=2560057 RepID=UPI001073917F|nr:hypothetical protein [Terasakiella sp. SH-1]